MIGGMRLVDDLLRLSATDLANHLGCLHLSQQNRAVAEGRAQRPRWKDPLADLLRERGFEHEKAYLSHLRSSGNLHIVEIDRDDTAGSDKTTAAMRAGADVIYQAQLGGERWYGIADFLRKVERPSALGAWSYEVTDAKLATETRAGTILQLCVYSELVAGVQDLWPVEAHVVAPHHDFEPEAYRLADFTAYYRLVKTAPRSRAQRRSLARTPSPCRSATSALGGRTAIAIGAATIICASSRASAGSRSRSSGASISRRSRGSAICRTCRGPRAARATRWRARAIKPRFSCSRGAAARRGTRCSSRSDPSTVSRCCPRRRRTISSSISRAIGSRRAAGANICSVSSSPTTPRSARACRRHPCISRAGPRPPTKRSARSSSSSI